VEELITKPQQTREVLVEALDSMVSQELGELGQVDKVLQVGLTM
jgi:hypothetical protein